MSVCVYVGFSPTPCQGVRRPLLEGHELRIDRTTMINTHTRTHFLKALVKPQIAAFRPLVVDAMVIVDAHSFIYSLYQRS